MLEAATCPTFAYCYIPQIDAVTHRHGAASPADHETRRTVGETLACGFVRSLDGVTAAETLLVVTADHDMRNTDTGPAGCEDLSAIDAVVGNLSRGPDGRRIPPLSATRGLRTSVS